ncbi:MAG: hypothetical protein ACI4E5_03230 [Suilimivivens sp.]
MPHEITLTTAEDIIAVTDAVLARAEDSNLDFICEFADISEMQAKNALHMAEELNLIESDSVHSTYSSGSFLGRLLVSSRNDNHKAAIMRLIIEQYETYITLKTRYAFTETLDLASKQEKTLYSMTANYKDIKNTIISIATYVMGMINDGASCYKFNNDDVLYIEIVDLALKFKANDDNALKQQLGEKVYNYIDRTNVFNSLSDAYSKIQNADEEVKAIILYAGNAFESFLQQIASEHSTSLVGKNSILQKADALSGVLSKKHRGMISYIGQVRNAADHGADVDEGGRTWEVSEETAYTYPIIIANLIKNICQREDGRLFV